MKITKPVKRETDAFIEGRPLMLEVHPVHVSLRPKGLAKKRRIKVEYRDMLLWPVKIAGAYKALTDTNLTDEERVHFALEALKA